MKKILSLMLAAALLAVSASAFALVPGEYSATEQGFGGPVTVTITVDDNAVTAVNITGDNETPGLGAKADTWFQADGKAPVVGKHPAEARLTVKKDGGEVDAISGSTITSRSFLQAVSDAYEVFQKINA